MPANSSAGRGNSVRAFLRGPPPNRARAHSEKQATPLPDPPSFVASKPHDACRDEEAGPAVALPASPSLSDSVSAAVGVAGGILNLEVAPRPNLGCSARTAPAKHHAKSSLVSSCDRGHSPVFGRDKSASRAGNSVGFRPVDPIYKFLRAIYLRLRKLCGLERAPEKRGRMLALVGLTEAEPDAWPVIRSECSRIGWPALIHNRIRSCDEPTGVRPAVSSEMRALILNETRGITVPLRPSSRGRSSKIWTGWLPQRVLVREGGSDLWESKTSPIIV